MNEKTSIERNDDVDCCDINEVHSDLLEVVCRGLPPTEETERMAELFKAFGDGTRLRILLALSAAEVCVCDLSAALNMTPSAISHQLSLLKRRRLIQSRRDGKSVFYSLADDHVHSIIRQGREHIEE